MCYNNIAKGLNMFNQKEYINKFIKENYKTIKLRIKNNDNLLINKINSVDNINQYIISLITKDIFEHREYHFIDNSIEIDFELSKTMKDLVDRAERADILGDYGLYMNLVYAIDSQGKFEASRHLISESEWYQLVRRYSL